jgi:succinate dehydrogenase/fumarate reductase flavoprotein subunit
MDRFETHTYDVLVVGAGGAGLRAAIEAAGQGVRVGLVCKSLLGKAHTVMAEGGMAAALSTTDDRDSWQVHFRDTMRGGKMLNHWRMAQLLALEAPDRVKELEAWGALFDRTPDGRILQRNFGGHQYPRLAHVGDRTGLEMIRTLQDKSVGDAKVDVFMECTVARLLKDGDRTGLEMIRTLQDHAIHQGIDVHMEVTVSALLMDGGRVAGHLELLGVHGRRAWPRLPRRCRAHRHGIHPVPPHGHGVAAVGSRHPRHRVGAR